MNLLSRPFGFLWLEATLHSHFGGKLSQTYKRRCQISSCKLRQLTTTGVAISLAHEFVGVLPGAAMRAFNVFAQ